MSISEMPTSELVHNYLESYMDIARCELAVRLDMPASDRLIANGAIVTAIAIELARRGDTTLFDRRDIILGAFQLGAP